MNNTGIIAAKYMVFMQNIIPKTDAKHEVSLYESRKTLSGPRIRPKKDRRKQNNAIVPQKNNCGSLFCMYFLPSNNSIAIVTKRKRILLRVARFELICRTILAKMR